MRGKRRLAHPGYYIEYFGAKNPSPSVFSIIHISSNGKCKYIHFLWGDKWSTLSWVAAPTRRKVVQERFVADTEEIDRYIYFKTFAELQKFDGIECKPGAKEPSPLPQ